MTIDWFVFFPSLIFGAAIGFFAGLYSTHRIADQIAKRAFDALMLLRSQAKEQMDTYEDSLAASQAKGKK